MSNIPPRGPALSETQMLLSFDVDCGELISGHRFIARGLSGPIGVTDPEDWDAAYPSGGLGSGDGDGVLIAGPVEPSAFAPGEYPGFGFEYEIIPGMTEAETGGVLWNYLVGISYTADVDLPWEPNDGGAIAPAEGGDSTHGSRGDWPLPPAATVLTFALFAVESGFPSKDPAGHLVVDLARSSAQWRPAGGSP